MVSGLPHGYTVEPVAPGLFRVATDVVVAADMDLSGYSEFTIDDLHSLTRRDRVDLTRDSWLVRHEGDPIAFGLLWDSKPNELFYSFGVVRKRHQGLGIGTMLFEAAEARARERGGAGTVLRTIIDMNEPHAARLAESRGFRFVRRNWSMRVKLDSLPEVPAIPEGISIRRGTASEEDARLLHELVNETFEDHWGFVPRSYEEFSRMFLARTDNDPEMWFFAYEGDEPVGVLLGQMAGDEGWVGDLGVRKAWRKRGVGEALLRIVFRAFYEKGIDRVGLAVDTGNETGAVRLYERVGMEPARGDDEYERVLD
jgi:ribosomal protein S18 acetylase RimI-like enzyme